MINFQKEFLKTKIIFQSKFTELLNIYWLQVKARSSQASGASELMPTFKDLHS